MNRMNYCFQKSENAYKIYLYDDITKHGGFNWETWEFEDSETSAKHFRELLDQIPNGSEIELHINSNGGSVSEGTAIFNLLEQHDSKKTGIVDGVCHSIAFTILQGCDKRVMGYGTSAIIHNMWMNVTGNSSQLRKTADDLDAHMESCIQLYMRRAIGITEDELRRMLDKETVLTPQMALEYGFADEIGFSEKKPDEETLQAVLQENKFLKQQLAEQKSIKDTMSAFVKSNYQKAKNPTEEKSGFEKFFKKKEKENEI